MRKYLRAYIIYIDRLLAEKDAEKLEKIRDEHLKQIEFMQHERLMHLIVTVLFSLILFITIGILAYTNNIVYCFLTAMLLALLVPYIMHYYFLENSVQKMYKQYNSMISGFSLPDECRDASQDQGKNNEH